MTDHKPKLTADELDDATAPELRALIEVALNELRDLEDPLEALADTHQRGLGFLTVSGRQMLDKQVRAERDARVPNLKAGVVITGDVPAPVNIAAVSLAGEIPLTLLHLARRIRRRIGATGVCLIRRLPTHPQPAEVRADLRYLVPLVRSKPLLVEITRTVQDLTDRAHHLVHGNDRTEHPKPCPHCGRHTLVVYLQAGLVRCELDPHTGKYETCLCDDSYCPCKVRHHRHEWRRATKASKRDSWYGLARDQARLERETRTPSHP